MMESRERSVPQAARIPCGQCRAPVAPSKTFFSTTGAEVCKWCYFAEQSAITQARAAEAARGTPGLVVTTEGSAVTTMLSGCGVFGLGLLWLAAGIIVAERVYLLPLFLMGAGFVAFARGWHMQRGRR